MAATVISRRDAKPVETFGFMLVPPSLARPAVTNVDVSRRIGVPLRDGSDVAEEALVIHGGPLPAAVTLAGAFPFCRLGVSYYPLGNFRSARRAPVW